MENLIDEIKQEYGDKINNLSGEEKMKLINNIYDRSDEVFGENKENFKEDFVNYLKKMFNVS